MTNLDDILAAAQSLPATEKAQLIAALWESTPPEDWVQPSEAWLQEVKRRSEAMDAGSMKTSPWSDVRKRARDRAGLDD